MARIAAWLASAGVGFPGKRLAPWLPWLAGAGVGFALLLPLPEPGRKIGWHLPGLDKLVHAALFLVLGWVWLRWGRGGDRLERGDGLLALLGLAAYGGALELFQHWSGLRAAEWADGLANGAGLALAGWIESTVRARRGAAP